MFRGFKDVDITSVMYTWQVSVSFLGWLSDLKLGDKKVTLNHLVHAVFCILNSDLGKTHPHPFNVVYL